MSTELAVPQYSVRDLDLMAERAAKSGLFNMTKDQAFTLGMLCVAEGLHPIQAIKRYHIIEGKPSMRADAMQAEFQRHGGRIRWIETSAAACAAEFSHPTYHPDPCLVRITFAELDTVGVTRGKYGVKDNWKKFPAAMLRARVISAGVRMIDPGVIVGIYTPEEVQDFVDESRDIKAHARVIEAPQPKAIEQTQGLSTADLVAYLKQIDPNGENGHIDHLQAWGRERGYPAKIGKWTAEQANEGYAELVRRMSEPEEASQEADDDRETIEVEYETDDDAIDAQIEDQLAREAAATA